MDENVNILKGLSKLVNQANIKPGLNLFDIEKGMVSGEETAPKSMEERFSEELKQIELSTGINLEADALEDDGADDGDSEDDELPLAHEEKKPSKVRAILRDDDEITRGDLMRGDTEFLTRTREQDKKKIIKNVIEESNDISLEQYRENDLKYRMLADIDSLTSALVNAGDKLERIPTAGRDSTFEEIESVLKLLRRKNDILRYRSFAEEALLLASHGLEELCNGEREWFGRYRPDLRGWHQHVNMKLRRMQHDTGQLVCEYMQEYNVGPLQRILLELVPSMLIYSKTRKENFTRPDITDADVMNTNRNIRDIMGK